MVLGNGSTDLRVSDCVDGSKRVQGQFGRNRDVCQKEFLGSC